MTVRKLLTAILVSSLIPVALATEAVAQGPGRGGGAPLTLPGAGPAAVPAAVAIPRPSTAEVEAAQRALTRFVETADAPTRAILQKYPDLVAIRPPVPNTAIVPSLAAGFVAKHQANLEVAKQGDANVLFMGDSITDFWRNPDGAYAGKPVLDKYFGHWKVANFGIAGDTTQGVLYRLKNGEGKGFSPKAVMLMIGTNNTGRNTAAEIAEGIGAVVLQLQNDLPGARILLLGVFPRGRAADPVRGTIAEINRTIAKLHDGNRVHYLDIGAAFLDADGNIPRDVMSDGLHPTGKGYEIWAKAVIAPLTALVGTAPNAAQAPLNFDTLVGVWSLTYDDGQTGTFTFSKNADGTSKVVVSTMAGGESVAKDVVIKGDTITFTRDINVQGLTGSVTYTAKLVDGALKGAGDVKLGDPGGGAPGGGAPTPFTATRAK
jgi:lysophospholipase L1-like esterase